MLVSEYVLNNINNRPLKYGTKQSYIKGIKSIGIWDMEISELNSALIIEKFQIQANGLFRLSYNLLGTLDYFL